VALPDRDFPRIPDPSEAKFEPIDGGVLTTLIDKTFFSIANDETRYHLSGVLFKQVDGKAEMASTDGHRLSVVKRDFPGAPALPTAGLLIPKKGLVELKRVIGMGAEGCEMAVSKDTYLFLRTAGVTLAVKLTNSQFPDYDKVVPTSNHNRVVVNRAALIDALKRTTLVHSSKKGTSISVKFSASPGTLVLTSDTSDIGAFREEIEADYTNKDVYIGFNPSYVLQLVSHIDTDKVALELGDDALSPGIIRPDGDDSYFGVVMPMRVD
jgi:DNA polymerase-3 subunit beta